MGNRGYGLTSACPDLHAAYDRCETAHLDAFRRGESSIDNPCRDAWEDYKQCVMELWDAKTQDYLARRAAARGEAPPPAAAAHTDARTAAASASTPSSSPMSDAASSPSAVAAASSASNYKASSDQRSTTQR